MSSGFGKALRAAAGSLALGCFVIGSGVVDSLPASAALVVNTITVGTTPIGVSSDGTHVWVANASDNTVIELDASTGAFVNTIGVGRYPDAVSSDGTHVWVANSNDGTVSEIVASTGSVVNTIHVGIGPDAVSSDGTHVWVANLEGNSMTELDASTGAVVQTISILDQPNAVSSDGTHVWVTTCCNTVTELDASTGAFVDAIGVGKNPNAVSSDGVHVWVTSNFGNLNTVTELNASTGAFVKTIGVDCGPGAVSSDGVHVWVTIQGCNTPTANTVTELDASTGAFVNAIGVGKNPLAVSSDGTHVWVANSNDSTVTEVDPKSPQVIAFTSPLPATVVVGSQSYTPTTSSGASTSPVVITLDPASTGCTLTSGVVHFTAVGTCVIDANQAGDPNYNPAPQVQQSISVITVPQSINFTSVAPTTISIGGSPYSPVASASSGLTVLITLDPASTGCTLTSGVVHFTAVGTCIIDANQAGNSEFGPSPQVQQIIPIAKSNQAISFTSTVPAIAAVGGPTYAVSADSSSGLPVTLAIDSSATSVCSISVGVVSFTGVGTCVVDANQPGDPDFMAAPTVQQTVTVKCLAITTTAVPNGQARTGYSTHLLAIGGNLPYTWKITSGSLPKGIKLNKKTGVLSGKPSKAATSSTFTVEVLDTKTKRTKGHPPTQNTATAQLSITITP